MVCTLINPRKSAREFSKFLYNRLLKYLSTLSFLQKLCRSPGLLIQQTLETFDQKQSESDTNNQEMIISRCHQRFSCSSHFLRKQLSTGQLLFICSSLEGLYQETTCPMPLHLPHVLPYIHPALLFCRKLLRKKQQRKENTVVSVDVGVNFNVILIQLYLLPSLFQKTVFFFPAIC